MRESGYYPPGAEHDPLAPWNESVTPEKEFEIIVSQTLSKSTTACTNDYVPGASGVDYEPDDEGGYYGSAWHELDDTSDTNWREAYHSSGGYTPLELIEEFRKHLEIELARFSDVKDSKRIKHLIEECNGWIEDDIYIEEE